MLIANLVLNQTVLTFLLCVGKTWMAQLILSISLWEVISLMQKDSSAHMHGFMVYVKYGLFLDFQYGFRSSWSTADLLTVVSDRVVMAINRSGTTRAVALDIFRLLAEFGMLVFFTNLSLVEFQGTYLVLFFLFSVIDGFEQFWMGSLHKNIQLMLEFLKAPFLVLHFSYYTLMAFLMILSVILLLCW